MERRIMKQGPSTLVVSLPSKWTKKHNVKKGDAIHVQERGKELLMALEPKPSERRITLNVSGTLPMTHRIAGALYKAGFDEMKLLYSTSKEAEAILDTVRVMTGHTVIKHENNVITIRRIARTDTESFPVLYRKCFYILQDMAQETILALERQDKELMRSVIVKDRTMAIFADYTRRMLLSGEAQEHAQERYYTVEQLEKIADQLKYLCRSYESASQAPSGNILTMLKRIISFLERFQNLFYDFSLEKLSDLGKEHERLQKNLEEAFQASAKKDMPALMHGGNILSLTFDLNGPLLTMQLR